MCADTVQVTLILPTHLQLSLHHLRHQAVKQAGHDLQTTLVSGSSGCHGSGADLLHSCTQGINTGCQGAADHVGRLRSHPGCHGLGVEARPDRNSNSCRLEQSA